jgi:hypothetical protein
MAKKATRLLYRFPKSLKSLWVCCILLLLSQPLFAQQQVPSGHSRPDLFQPDSTTQLHNPHNPPKRGNLLTRLQTFPDRFSRKMTVPLKVPLLNKKSASGSMQLLYDFLQSSGYACFAV